MNLKKMLFKQHEFTDYYRSGQAIYDDIFQGGMPDICTGESKRDIYYKSYVFCNPKMQKVAE